MKAAPGFMPLEMKARSARSVGKGSRELAQQRVNGVWASARSFSASSPDHRSHPGSVSSRPSSGRSPGRGCCVRSFPLELSQKPLFRLLGTRAEDKSHVLFEGGRIPPRVP
jgi:hypothetical protein